MELIFKLTLGCFIVDAIILAIGYIGVRYVKSRWPGWWECWIAAPYPDEVELDDDHPVV